MIACFAFKNGNYPTTGDNDAVYIELQRAGMYSIGHGGQALWVAKQIFFFSFFLIIYFLRVHFSTLYLIYFNFFYFFYI